MDVISLSAIKKAKKEIVDLLNKIDGQALSSIGLELQNMLNTLSKLDMEKLGTADFQQTMSAIQKYIVDSITSGVYDRLSEADFDSWKAPWTGTRAAKLDNIDAKVSSRADGSYYTPARASKLDKLDATVSSRLSRVEFAQQNEAWDVVWGEVLNDLKKLSAEYRDRIAAVLGQMDVAGLSTEDSIKLLTQYLEGIPIIGAAGSTLTTQGGSYTIPRGYHNGRGSVRTNITNLRPENIKSGANVGGVVGTLSPKINFTERVTGYSNKDATCTIPFNVLYYFWVIQKNGYNADSVYTYIVFPDGSYHVVKGDADKWTNEWISESISNDKHSFTNRSFNGIGVYVTWSS